MAPARGIFRPEPTIKHVRMVPETHMFQTIKHCVPRRKTLTRRATAERWENTIFRPTIYHQAFIHVCVKNYQIIVILEAKTLCKTNKIIDFLNFRKLPFKPPVHKVVSLDIIRKLLRNIVRYKCK